MAVPTTGVLALIAKAADVDVDAAGELWRLSLFEALADLTENAAPLLDRDFAKASQLTRRALVRTYLTKRLDGVDVGAVLRVAADVTLVEVAKTESAEQRRDAVRDEPRNRGRWARRNAAAQDRIRDFVTAPAGVGPNPNETALSAVTRGGGDDDTDRRIYRRLHATGRALASLGPGTHAELIGHAAALIGDLGPEAEKVLGNPIRRTAYRYRGTERRPDRGMQREVASLNTQVDAYARLSRDNPAEAETLRARVATGAGGRNKADVDAVVSYQLREHPSTDQLRLGAVSDLATARLARQLPDLEHAKLSLASGQLPPSRGVIIDADGDLVSEAQGFQGDHYLPFDLRNLRRLHGGAYVRTRTTGGPTDEDIYTGLLTGARQLQVVSASGVFTVEFDPDLRGGRRYSDKARAMVHRYARLLAAVGSKQVYANDLSASEVAEARRKIATDPRYEHLSPEQVKTLGNEAVDRLREQRRYATRSDEELHEDALSRAEAEMQGKPGGGARLQDLTAHHYARLREGENANAVRAYRLDGKGYQAALTSLQQEFPFFIRKTSYQPLPIWLTARGLATDDIPTYLGGDIGRVKPGELRPSKAEQVGWPAGKTAARTGAASPAAESAADAATAAAAAPAAADASLSAGLSEGTRPLAALLADRQTKFVRDFGTNLKALFAHAQDPALNGQFLALPADVDEAGAGVDPAILASWSINKDAATVGTFVLADPSRLNLVDRVAASVQKALAEGEYSDYLPDLKGQLTTARIVTAGFVHAAGDPVLGTPEDGRPVGFAEIEALGDKPSNYANYLTANPDVAAAVEEVDGESSEETQRRIVEAVDRLEALHRYAAAGFNPDAAGQLDATDQAEAKEAHDLGTSAPSYRKLAALQKAFAFSAQFAALHALTGAVLPAGEPAPKVPAPAAAPSPVVKRAPRIVVHPPGSPASLALAKRRGSRSAQPASPRRGT